MSQVPPSNDSPYGSQPYGQGSPYSGSSAPSAPYAQGGPGSYTQGGPGSYAQCRSVRGRGGVSRCVW